MPHNFRTFKYAFLGCFIAAVALISGYETLYGIPKKKCEDAGNWWSDKYRSCATPVYLPSITHRPIGSVSASAASDAGSGQVTIDFHEGAKKASNAH